MPCSRTGADVSAIALRPTLVLAPAVARLGALALLHVLLELRAVILRGPVALEVAAAGTRSKVGSAPASHALRPLELAERHGPGAEIPGAEVLARAEPPLIELSRERRTRSAARLEPALIRTAGPGTEIAALSRALELTRPPPRITATLRLTLRSKPIRAAPEVIALASVAVAARARAPHSIRTTPPTARSAIRPKPPLRAGTLVAAAESPVIPAVTGAITGTATLAAGLVRTAVSGLSIIAHRGRLTIVWPGAIGLRQGNSRDRAEQKSDASEFEHGASNEIDAGVLAAQRRCPPEIARSGGEPRARLAR